MINHTKIDRFIELHDKDTPFEEIATSVGITHEQAFVLGVTALSIDFEMCEDPMRPRPKQAYLDLLAAMAAFVKAGRSS
jgi:hypothetical protein